MSMPAERPPETPPEGAGSAPGNRVARLPTRGGGLVAPRLDLTRLAERLAEIEAGAEGTAREAEVLKLLAALTSAGAVLLLQADGKELKPVHRLVAGPAQSAADAIERTVDPVARKALQTGAAELAFGDDYDVLAVRLGAEAQRVLALVLQLRRQPPEPFLAVLQLFAAVLCGEPATARRLRGEVAGKTAALDLALRVAKGQPNPAAALAEALRVATGAKTVVVVRLVSPGRARVAAVTGSDGVDRRASLPRTLEAAALLVAGTAVAERHRAGAGAGAAMDRLLDLLPAQEIISLPIGQPASATALLAFDRFEAPAGERLTAVAPALPVVAPLLRQTTLAKPRAPRWRLVAGGLLAVAVAALFVPVPHRLSAPLHLVPESRRVVTAPFDGVLAESLVERGAKVAAGQTLARLEDQALRLEHERLSAEAERALRERDMAVSLGQATQAELKRLEYERARLAAEVIADRLARVEVVSPIDGVVTTDELDQAVGAPLRAGDPLFEVAPLDRLTGEIALPAKSIAYLPEQAEAILYLDAFPGWELALPIDRISPKATVEDGVNVFVLETRLDNGEGRLLPGLRGEAVIDAGREPLGWVLFHEAWERVARWLR